MNADAKSKELELKRMSDALDAIHELALQLLNSEGISEDAQDSVGKIVSIARYKADTVGVQTATH